MARNGEWGQVGEKRAKEVSAKGGEECKGGGPDSGATRLTSARCVMEKPATVRHSSSFVTMYTKKYLFLDRGMEECCVAEIDPREERKR